MEAENRKRWHVRAYPGQNAVLYGYILTNESGCQFMLKYERDFSLSLDVRGREFGQRMSARRNGSFRTVWGGGGGNAEHTYAALHPLLRALYDYGTEKPVLTPLRVSSLKPRDWVWRHMDDHLGYIGLMVAEGGHIVLALAPLDSEITQTSGACMTFRREETHKTVQKALLGLYDGLAKDNKERPDYFGMH